MNVFVDSNIFLDFYHFADDDLDELKKLIDLIKNGDISLIVTSQVADEIKRNRDNKVYDAYKKFKNSGKSIDLPQMSKPYSEYVKIRDLQRELKRTKTDLEEKLAKDIADRTLKADETIYQLLELTEILDTSSYVLEARNRMDLGNPPGKNGSLGDAITWCTILGELEDNKELFFISDDKDYKSSLDENDIDSFLKDEWQDKKRAEIFFYTRLSNFFKEHHNDIQLKVEEEKNELIEALSTSHNFATTHSIVAKLSRYVSFTDEQIRDLAAIAETNSQVNWILEDPDVRGFYEVLLDGKEHVIPQKQYEYIIEKMNPSDSDEPDIDLDDLLSED